MSKRTKRTIRLRCDGCNVEHDGITPAQLRKLRSKGWKNITRIRTYAQSCKTYDDPRDAPPGYSFCDWETHLGDCPECVKEAEATTE